METFLSCDLDQISDYIVKTIVIPLEVRDNSLVGANASGFESLRAQLFVLVGNHVNA